MLWNQYVFLLIQKKKCSRSFLIQALLNLSKSQNPFGINFVWIDLEYTLVLELMSI